MKHGDKAKAKAAKASKPSDKKSSAKAGEKGGKAVAQSSRETKAKASPEKGSGKKAGAEARSAPRAGNGRSPGDDAGVFNSPVIAAAFKRAVKKYANTFRRLTD